MKLAGLPVVHLAPQDPWADARGYLVSVGGTGALVQGFFMRGAENATGSTELVEDFHRLKPVPQVRPETTGSARQRVRGRTRSRTLAGRAPGIERVRCVI